MAQSLGEPRHLNADTSNHDEQELDVLGTSSEPQAPSTRFSLPPVDTGTAAWLFLAACWGVEALTFGEILHNDQNLFSRLTEEEIGFGFSFGVFQDFYSNHAPFAGSGGIAAIGTTTTV
ncbi:major facilitator superfamily domain, general substrate transporter [Trichoderma arundinaceum]|uniref:Major facilitator superfamily domain, general substrate transporter n=1 Tax=Trichoderma arundinaceum TaxID=490622 RepID=A0A395NAR9_TRIAR|nr:major facilitator superfamily domain, general substrate transporter [Trichoderma arundinaceum]